LSSCAIRLEHTIQPRPSAPPEFPKLPDQPAPAHLLLWVCDCVPPCPLYHSRCRVPLQAGQPATSIQCVHGAMFGCVEPVEQLPAAEPGRWDVPPVQASACRSIQQDDCACFLWSRLPDEQRRVQPAHVALPLRVVCCCPESHWPSAEAGVIPCERGLERPQ
jgi:hypothetical protein